MNLLQSVLLPCSSTSLVYAFTLNSFFFYQSIILLLIFYQYLTIILFIHQCFQPLSENTNSYNIRFIEEFFFGPNAVC